jgi:hypothetical protein
MVMNILSFILALATGGDSPRKKSISIHWFLNSELCNIRRKIYFEFCVLTISVFE